MHIHIYLYTGIDKGLRQSDIDSIDKSKEIIEFIKKNPNCDKEKVITYCNNKGISSRVTTRKILDALEKDKIININKPKRNSKSYGLNISKGSLLVTVSADLEELFMRYKRLINCIKASAKESRPVFVQKLDKSSSGENFVLNKVDLILSLPYDIIQIINNVYTFYLNFILPKEMEDKSVVDKIYSVYFKYLYEMYLFISKEMPNENQSHDIASISKSPMYQSYLNHGPNNGFDEVCNAALFCKQLGIDEPFFEVLDLLWNNNVKFIELVYGFYDANPVDYKRMLEGINKTFSDYDYENETLRNMHITLDSSTYGSTYRKPR